MGRPAAGSTWGWQPEESANDRPLCSRGGCGEPAEPDGEWCKAHRLAIEEARAPYIGAMGTRGVGRHNQSR